MKIKNEKIMWAFRVASAIATGSKDPSTQVGCLILNQDFTPASFGMNGFIKGCDESLMTYDKPMKYHLILHAEENACLLAKKDLSGTIVFVTHAPCNKCLSNLLQSGAKAVYFRDPGPVIDRGTPEQKDAIIRMIKATKIPVNCLPSNDSKLIPYLKILAMNEDELKKLKEKIVKPSFAF